MKQAIKGQARWASLGLAALILTGCANAPKPLYYWPGYQTQVYSHLTAATGPEEQIAALEEGLQKARSAGLTPAPGYHAQLGMLYAEIGKPDQVRQQFETEKSLFPESSAYMDFLMRNMAAK